MNIDEILNNNFSKEVPNPEYNPRAKKNKKPKTINVPDYSGDNYDFDWLGEGIRESYPKSFVVPTSITDRYSRNGLTYNEISPNLYLEIVDKQSSFEKVRNGVYQTIVSEIGLGTLRGISDLFDFVGSKILNVTEDDYTNPVSQKIQEWQEEFKNNYEVYVDPNKSIANGGLFDLGWWMSNIPSIASSLTLMLPAVGTTRLLGAIGKSTKLFKGIGNTRKFLTDINRIDKATNAGESVGRLGQLSKWINSGQTVRTTNQLVDYGLSGFLSRVLENYQESNQVLNDLLPDMVDTINNMDDDEYRSLIDRNKEHLQNVDVNNKQAVAKALAKASADVTFRDDMINGIFDAYQLYALRNVKRFMNAPMRASIRREHLNSLRYPGKTPEEVEKLLSGRNFLDKTKDKLSDVLYGSKVALTAEFSEGIEEAVNYIAQEEGMRYGHILLGTLNDNSTFDDRLKKYLQAPKLYDSAFWGVLGGVTFHTVGSYFNRLQNAMDIKLQEAKRNYSEDSGQKKPSTPWNQAFADPELERRIGNVKQRYTVFNNLKTKLEQIRNKIDPWGTKNIDGTPRTLDTKEEQDIAVTAAYSEATTNLLMDAMFVGNWDITRAYLESNEFKNALVESGVISQQEADERQEQIKQTGDKIEELYDSNMRAIANAMHGEDEKTGAKFDDVPLEYMQIIAALNIRHQLNADQYLDNIAAYNPAIQSEEKRVADILKRNNIDYKRSVKLFILAKQIGEIQAELDDVNKSLKDNRSSEYDPRTISGQSAKRVLENRKQVLLDMLNTETSGIGDTATSNREKFKQASELLTVLRATSSLEKNKDGGYKVNVRSKRYKELDDKITKVLSTVDYTTDNLKTDLSNIDKIFSDFTQDEFKEVERQSRVVSETIASALGQNGTLENLNDISSTLLKSYAEITHNEIARNIELSEIARTKSQIIHAAHREHNEQNMMRAVILENMLDTIKRIHKRYAAKDASLNMLLAYGTLNKQSRDRLKEILSDEDFAIYDDAMRIIDLNTQKVTNRNGNTKIENALLPEYIQDALYRTEDDEFEGVSDNIIDDTSESSSTNQNSSESTETSETNNPSTEQRETNTSNESALSIDFLSDKQGKKLSIPTAEIVLKDDGAIVRLKQVDNILTDSPTRITLVPVDGENNTFFLNYKRAINNDDIDDTNPIFTNNKLFIIQKAVIDGGELIKNPKVVLNNNGTIAEIQLGIIDNPESDTGTESVAEAEEVNDDEAIISSTGEEDILYDDTPSDDDTYGTPIPDDYDSTEESVEEDVFDDIQDAAIDYAADKVNANEQYNEEEFRTKLKEEFGDKLQDDVFEQFFISASKTAKEFINLDDENAEETQHVAEFISNSTILDSQVNAAGIQSARKALQSSFDKILDDYANRAYVDTYNNKKVISIENLMRYIRSITNNNQMLTVALYDRFVDIINTTNKYILTEGRRLNKTKIITDSNISSDISYQQATDVNGRSLNLSLLLFGADEIHKTKIYAALDSLKPGDTLKYEIIDNGHGIKFSVNDVVISKLPVPTESIDKYYQTNAGWVYDTPKSMDGSTSIIGSVFEDIFSGVNPDITVALDKFIYTKRYIDNKSGEKVVRENNPEYLKNAENLINAIKQHLINKNIAPEYVIKLDGDVITQANHLRNVYNNFRDVTNKFLSARKLTREQVKDVVNRRRLESVRAWIKKQEDGIRTCAALAQNSGLRIKVDTINEGGLIIVPKEEAKPVNEDGVIAKQYKDKIDVLVASITEPGVIYSTNRESRRITNVNMSGGSTFVGIPRVNGEIEYVHAFPRKVNEVQSDKAKELHKAIVDEFKRVVNEWGRNKNMSVTNVTNFLNTLCVTKIGNVPIDKDRNSPICRGITVEPIRNNIPGAKIGFRMGKTITYVYFFDRNMSGNTSTVDFGNKERSTFITAEKANYATKRLVDLFEKALEFNISFDAVQGNANMKGYGKVNNKGEYTITIPNHEPITFASYKDFIINNGIINVTTKEQNGSNFYRPDTATTQNVKPRVTFKIVTTTSPVERIVSESPTTNRATAIPVGTKIKELIENSSETDVSNQIVTALLNNTQLEILSKSKLFKALDLSNIRYFDRLPEDAIGAHVNENTTINNEPVEKGTILVSNIWIDLINNPDTKEEAVRHLIHEGIHRHIKRLSDEDRTTLLNEVRTIFDAFVAANEADGLREAYRAFEYNLNAASVKRYYSNGIINEAGLEDFLIESITRPTLMNRLNEISEDGKRITNQKVGNIRSKNLFQKILAVIAKLFGVRINRGSLLAKEYALFKQVMETSVQNVVQAENNASNTIVKEQPINIKHTKENVEQEIQNIQNAILDENINDANADNVLEEDNKSVNELTTDDMGDFIDNRDDSMYSDEFIASMAQIRDKLMPENGITFERLINKGGIQTQC